MRSIFKFMSPQFLWLFSSLSPGRLFTSNGWVTCTSESTSTSGRSTSTSSTSRAASTSSPPPSTRCSTTWWAPSTGRLSPGLYSASPQIAQADRRITLVQQLPQIYLIGVSKFQKGTFLVTFFYAAAATWARSWRGSWMAGERVEPAQTEGAKPFLIQFHCFPGRKSGGGAVLWNLPLASLLLATPTHWEPVFAGSIPMLCPTHWKTLKAPRFLGGVSCVCCKSCCFELKVDQNFSETWGNCKKVLHFHNKKPA